MNTPTRLVRLVRLCYVAATFGIAGAGWSAYVGSTIGLVFCLCAAALFAQQALGAESTLRRVAAVQAAESLPPSLRELVAFVDSSAAVVLAEGHAAGVDAADRALDRVGDATSSLVEKATERRVLELAFERNTAGQGA